MTVTLESYSCAVRVGPRPRHVLHVQRNGEPRALCGLGPVVYVGDAKNIDEACGWPLCRRCADLAGADICEDWNDAET